MELLQPINATAVPDGGGGADINMWEGVPKGSLSVANEDYMYSHFHHTKGKNQMHDILLI